MSGMIDLSQLPEPSVIEVVSFELILAERKERFISLNPVEKQDARRGRLPNGGHFTAIRPHYSIAQAHTISR